MTDTFEYIVGFPSPLTDKEKKMIYGFQGEVIRCKDCFKRSTALCPFQLAKFGWHCDTDYCSRAERKE